MRYFNRNKVSAAFFIVIILALPLFIALLNLNLHINNKNFYLKQFETNNVYKSLGEQKVIENYNILINYFAGKDDLSKSFFNEKERQHLADVKSLISRARNSLYAIAILLTMVLIWLLYKKEYWHINKSLMDGSLLAIALLVFIFISAYFDFRWLFIKFHQILFINNLWILDPATDKLIVMFPEEFFYESFRTILINSAVTSGLIFFAGLVISYRIKKEG